MIGVGLLHSAFPFIILRILSEYMANISSFLDTGIWIGRQVKLALRHDPPLATLNYTPWRILALYFRRMISHYSSRSTRFQKGLGMYTSPIEGIASTIHFWSSKAIDALRLVFPKLRSSMASGCRSSHSSRTWRSHLARWILNGFIHINFFQH